MKPYSIYQYLPGTEMTGRDIKEQNSKFWNEGKWNNFVAPFIKEREGILVDMGCNAGLFLKMAEDMGFRAIGVDSSREAVERGQAWRKENKYIYQFFERDLNNCIDELPIADYTVLANAHYYLTINDWLDYVDKLQYKTRYVIIVTDEKRHMSKCWASADVEDIRTVFKNWDEVGHIGVLSQDDPSPRKLQGLCFKSRFIEKESVESIVAGDPGREDFYREMLGNFDSPGSVDYHETMYYKFLKNYRRKWDVEKLDKWVEDRIDNFYSIYGNGLRKPVILDRNNNILDGNHRFAVAKALGYKYVFIRRA